MLIGFSRQTRYRPVLTPYTPRDLQLQPDDGREDASRVSERCHDRAEFGEQRYLPAQRDGTGTDFDHIPVSPVNLARLLLVLVLTGAPSIWRHFIPSDSGHVFERGAYFSTEVIPDRLAVISLNTLFWYDSNTREDMLLNHLDERSKRRSQWLMGARIILPIQGLSRWTG